MANTTDTLVRQSDGTFYVARFSCLGDGTPADQTAAVLVDKSTLTAGNGKEPVALDLVKIKAVAFGITSVRLHWDHTTDDEIVSFGSGAAFEFEDMAGLRDPRTAGDTGDVLVTTLGMAASGGYIIDATFRLRQ